jgi:Cd2+/Zn2+-exporting ATPase
MDNANKPGDASATCGGAACCSHDERGVAEAPTVAGAAVYRIATMDRASEEGEIRRALEPLPGIRALRFQLGARTLAIDADAQHLPSVLEAIRRAGFDPQPLAASRREDGHGHGSRGHDHAHDDHAHGFGAGIGRLGAALGLAIAAEAVSYFAPPILAWKLAGLAVAAIAIWLAGRAPTRRVSPRCAADDSTSPR